MSIIYNSFFNQDTAVNDNDYLINRNKKFYRGHSTIIHPLYDDEINNGISIIKNFLHYSVIRQAYHLRMKQIMSFSAEKCWNNNYNNYTYAESERCEELIIERDAILNNLNTFNKEVEIRIKDGYEKNVKFSKHNSSVNNDNFSLSIFEQDHRKFLLNLNYVDRFYYYFLAKRLFIDSVNKNK